MAQPLVEFFPVDHAHEAVVDGDVHALVFGRNHAGGPRARHQQGIGDRKILDQPRRDRSPAGLDPPGPVQQQHRMPQTG
jgi:hypothetical protein